MRFHLTKSSTALLVFAAPPTTATSGTRLCQPCQTCSSVAVTAWKMSTEVSATCENHLKSGYRRATQSDVPYNHLKKYAPFWLLHWNAETLPRIFQNWKKQYPKWKKGEGKLSKTIQSADFHWIKYWRIFHTKWKIIRQCPFMASPLLCHWK